MALFSGQESLLFQGSVFRGHLIEVIKVTIARTSFPERRRGTFPQNPRHGADGSRPREMSTALGP